LPSIRSSLLMTAPARPAGAFAMRGSAAVPLPGLAFDLHAELVHEAPEHLVLVLDELLGLLRAHQADHRAARLHLLAELRVLGSLGQPLAPFRRDVVRQIRGPGDSGPADELLELGMAEFGRARCIEARHGL